MESLNLIKDHNKHEEKPNFHHAQLQSRRQVHGKRLLLYLAASAILLVAVLVALTVALLVHGSSKEVEVDESTSLKGALRTVCNVTLYPDRCLSSLSSSWNYSGRADPESILKVSLRVSADELSNMTSHGKTLLSPAIGADNNSSSNAVRDCLDVLESASDKVKESLNEMEVVGLDKKVLNSRKINDIRTWLSAAMTNQETCLEGLQEEASSNEGEDHNLAAFKSNLKICEELLSNSLAIVSHMDDLCMKFGLNMY